MMTNFIHVIFFIFGIISTNFICQISAQFTAVHYEINGTLKYYQNATGTYEPKAFEKVDLYRQEGNAYFLLGYVLTNADGTFLLNGIGPKFGQNVSNQPFLYMLDPSSIHSMPFEYKIVCLFSEPEKQSVEIQLGGPREMAKTNGNGSALVEYEHIKMGWICEKYSEECKTKGFWGAK